MHKYPDAAGVALPPLAKYGVERLILRIDAKCKKDPVKQGLFLSYHVMRPVSLSFFQNG